MTATHTEATGARQLRRLRPAAALRAARLRLSRMSYSHRLRGVVVSWHGVHRLTPAAERAIAVAEQEAGPDALRARHPEMFGFGPMTMSPAREEAIEVAAAASRQMRRQVCASA